VQTQLPDDVSAALARGVGAFLRATPAVEIPGPLRRFQKYRPQTLPAHSTELIAALEDSGLRARIVEWLEDKPRLDRKEAELLRIACERRDGWEKELKSHHRTRPRPAKTTAEAESGALDRERARARKAKDEARRAKEERDRMRRSERTQIAELKAEIQELRTEVARAQKQAEDATRRADAAEERLGRELRKARREVDSARAAREDFKKRARDAGKDARLLSRRIADLEARTSTTRRAGTPRRPPSPSDPEDRTPLRAPQGRLEDAPETLDVWLSEPKVHLVVDGYNVTKHAAGWPDAPLERQRELLEQSVARLVRRKKAKATIVWDGSDIPPGVGRGGTGAIRIEYSAPDTTADDHVVALLGRLSRHPVIVATSDRELQDRAGAEGATIATSPQLLALLH
jgi:predicted RNA-binding protein with PIN domain